MLWSLIRIVIFIALVAAAAFGAGFLIDTGGEVRLSFAGREYTFAPIVALIGLIVLLAVIWAVLQVAGLLMATFRFFNGDETAISRFFTRNRERKGYEALADGLVALAAGEGRLAQIKAARAERFLEKPELTNIVAAQAAELTGDTKKAVTYYKGLLADDRTRFVGVQGLLKQKLAQGDTDTALKLAEKAFALKPQHGATLETLFQLQTDKGEWNGARKTVEAKVRANTLPRDVGRRREAVLALADAQAALETGQVTEARQAALHANGLSPDLIPAAQLAAEMQTLEGNKRAATKIIKKAWAQAPHPDLATAFADIEPGESPATRAKRFAPLIRQNPDHPESKLLQAELLLGAEDFPAARRALGNLVETAPTARGLAIMAAIEKGEGAPDHVIRAWLAKALDAPRGPMWVCERCGKVHTEWMAVCDNCGGFDTLTWRQPQETPADPTARTLMPGMASLIDAPVENVEETAPAAEEIAEDAASKPPPSEPKAAPVEAKPA
ncbi:MAG: heme biosynthesis HemY N-terminal domain-containing protein [Pseudomonadota bacterium]